MWYLRLLLRVMGTLPQDKTSPAFSYKHNPDKWSGSPAASLGVPRCCSPSGVTNVHFPFRALHAMTQHLGTLIRSWAVYVSPGNHHHQCSGEGRHGEGTRDWGSRQPTALHYVL